MFEALNLGARHTIIHCLVIYVNRVIPPRNGLGFVKHGEYIHFRAQANKRDYQALLGLVFKVALFIGVKILMTTSEVRNVAITNFAKVDGDFEVGARVYLFCQMFQEKVKLEQVGVGVKHSNSLSENVFIKRIECVSVK